MGVYTKAHSLVKVGSVVLDLVGSNQFSYGCVIPNQNPFIQLIVIQF